MKERLALVWIEGELPDHVGSAAPGERVCVALPVGMADSRTETQEDQTDSHVTECRTGWHAHGMILTGTFLTVKQTASSPHHRIVQPGQFASRSMALN